MYSNFVIVKSLKLQVVNIKRIGDNYMDSKMIIELIGYLGSALVVVSMLMSSVVKLRIINSIGSTIFAGYALVIHSYPTAIMNIFLVCINIYGLYKLLKNDAEYELIEAVENDSYFAHFVKCYEDDIRKFFPDANINVGGRIAYMICNRSEPVGILVGTKKGNGDLDIELDYTTPMYRDCSVGKYLYQKLAGKGFNKCIYSKDAKNHEDYLNKMGFSKTSEGYVKSL